MAKRRGASHNGEAQYAITQKNLDKKGKTNKKLRRNAMASKYLSTEGQRLKDEAKAFMEAHPAGSGRRHKAKIKEIEKRIVKKLA